MSEFTGERVIPGLVDADLFNEHLARYKFAARLLRPGANALDLGCGTGYGSAQLTAAASVTACDLSAEAIRHAREHYARPGVRFLQASVDKLPLAGSRFDLITAFEVIEHLENWADLISEAARVLRPGGLFIVSTPNKAYYAETRAQSGPNPFHCHEFEYAEFETALRACFPHVRLWTQNHAGSIVFAPAHPQGASIDAGGASDPASAHFFLAVCSDTEFAFEDVYAWLPDTGNVLRERETHIARLDALHRQALEIHAALQRKHEAAIEEMDAANRWAATLNATIAERDSIITSLQAEAEQTVAWAKSLDAANADLTQLATNLRRDLDARTVWAQNLQQELDTKSAHVQLLLHENREWSDTISALQANIQTLEATLAALKAERRQIANSQWLRLGRTLRLGPVLTDSD